MARKPRIHFPGAFYHVILRGNNKMNIFFSTRDRKYFYYLMGDGVARYHHRIHGFCLMDNHVHLVMQVGHVALSKIIQNLSFRYAQHINKWYGKIGHLFQGRFKAIMIEEDAYLLELIRYIHLNPVRASMVSMPEEYEWSSHQGYLGKQKISWLTCEYVYSYFNGLDPMNKYIQFIKNNREESKDKKFHIGNHHQYCVLGSDNFLEKINQNKEVSLNVQLNLADIVKIISDHYSVELVQLIKKVRTTKSSRVRALIAWVAKECEVCSFAEVAKYFNRDPTGLVRVLRRLEQSSIGRDELNLCKELVLRSVGIRQV